VGCVCSEFVPDQCSESSVVGSVLGVKKNHEGFPLFLVGCDQQSSQRASLSIPECAFRLRGTEPNRTCLEVQRLLGFLGEMVLVEDNTINPGWNCLPGAIKEECLGLSTEVANCSRMECLEGETVLAWWWDQCRLGCGSQNGSRLLPWDSKLGLS
jgi:hypothetical protein